MADNIDVVVEERGSAEAAAALRSIAGAARESHTELERLKKMMTSIGRSNAAVNSLSRLGASAQTTQAHISNLNSAMGALNSQKLVVNIGNANNSLRNTRRDAIGAADSIHQLIGAFAGFEVIRAAVGGLVQAQIGMQQIHYGLVSASGSAQLANEQFEYLRRNADLLGVDLQKSSQEYTRLSASASAMNVAIEDQQALYTALSKSSTVLHLDAQKMQYATLALTQMFSKGRIQAEELRRQLGEAIPGAAVRFQQGVMQVIKGTDLAKYSFDDLMKRGLLDTKKFLPQLIGALEGTAKGWQDAANSLHAEITRLGNEWFELRVKMSSGLFSQAMAAGVRFLTDNLESVTHAVIGLGAALAVALAPLVVITLAGWMKVLAGLVWATAGPFGVLAAVVVGATAALVSMRNEIKLGVDDTTSLGDLMSVVWSDIKNLYNQAAQDVSNFFGITNTESEKSAKKLEDTWYGKIRTILNAFDGMGATIRAIFVAIFQTGANFIRSLADHFTLLGQAVGKAMSGDFAGAGELAAKIVPNALDFWKKTGEDWGKILNASFEQQAKTGLVSVFDDYTRRAQELAKQRKKVTEKVGGGTGGGGKEEEKDAGGVKTKPDKSLDKLGTALSSLISRINPTESAIRKLSEAQRILGEVNEKGTPQMKALVAEYGGAAEIIKKLTAQYREQLDPVGYMIENLQAERDGLRLVGDEYEINAEMLRITTKLKKDNYDVSETSLIQLREEIRLNKEANELHRAKQQILAGTIGEQRKAGSRDITAMGELSGQMTEGDKFNALNKALGGVMDGTSGAFKAELEQYQMYYDMVEQFRQQDVANEQLASEAKKAIKRAEMDLYVSKTSEGLGVIAGLMSSNNAKAFKIGQAAAIAQVAVTTPSAAMKAYESVAMVPFVGQALGVAAAAATVAMGMQQISQIRSQQPPAFRTGGSMVVGGSGGIDSQLVQFNATPGEHVSVNTPAEARAMQELRDEMKSGRRGGGSFTQTVIIQQNGRADNRTADQQARKVRLATQKEYTNNG